MSARNLFRLLLRLYPARYREVFGAEILAVCERTVAEHPGLWRALFEGAGLIIGALREWIAVSAGPADYIAIAAQPSENYGSMPEELREAHVRVDRCVSGMVHAIAHQRYEQARRISQEEQRERAVLRTLLEKYRPGEVA